eukprot:TRINITY_DN10900_c0_g1_i2.p1 TRINITY_DN10900_c0_g1~~TRINITY_DN10900_c0_g1_i2.p1  ORF type:complete len:393 (+),score=103.75 TRINITY_DN10900_c0_g1_i2:195-1373(+)
MRTRVLAWMLALATASSSISVLKELGENREWFSGESSLVDGLENKLNGGGDKLAAAASSEEVRTVDEALEKAAEAAREAEKAAGSLVRDRPGAGDDASRGEEKHRRTEEKDQSLRATQKALQALRSASKQVSEFDQGPEESGQVKREEERIMSKLGSDVQEAKSDLGESGSGKVKGSVKDAAVEIVDSAFEELQRMQTKRRSGEADAKVMTSTQAAVEKMVNAANEESRKRQIQAAREIAHMEKLAAKRLSKVVNGTTSHIDHEIATRVHRAEAKIEHKMEEQIADQIAASQVETLFAAASESAKLKAQPRGAGGEPDEPAPALTEKKQLKTTEPATSPGLAGKPVSPPSANPGPKKQPRAKQGSGKPVAPVQGHDDMQILFGPNSKQSSTT